MFKRISNLFRGFFGLFVSGLERQNPEALLEVETENLRKQIGQYNQGLATHAGLCERLMTQVRKQEADQRDLRAKTTVNLKAGNRDVAAQYAVRLQTLDRDLEENKKQLEQAEATYKDLVRARDVSINSARQKIETLRSSISDMKMKKAMAELTEMASGMITNIGGSGDTLNRLSGMVRAVAFRGEASSCEVELPGGKMLRVTFPNAARAASGLKAGDAVWLGFAAEASVVLAS